MNKHPISNWYLLDQESFIIRRLSQDNVLKPIKNYTCKRVVFPKKV